MKKNKIKIHKKIKKYLIPHEDNNYHPHIFRNISISFIISVCIFLLGVSLGNFLFLNKTVLGVNIASNVLIDLANVSRAENKIGQLKKSDKLDDAAEMKAEHMIANKYFDHFSPEGISPWSFMHIANYNFVYAGENLAINFIESLDVHNAWMNSPTHRENLLNPRYKEIGIGTHEGIYKGNNSIYIVQMFGTESVQKIVPKTPVKTKQDVRLADATTDVNNDTENLEKNITISTTSLAVEDTYQNVKVVATEGDTMIFKNDDLVRNQDQQVAGAEEYSTWWERFLFSGNWYIQLIYFLIIFVITVAFLFRIFIEYERQHQTHVIYSALSLVIVLLLGFINYQFVITSFIK